MFGKKLLQLGRELLDIYTGKRVSRCAAAMSYFTVLTVFPLLICLNAMLGSLFPTTERFYAFAEGLLPEETVRVLSDYLGYIGSHSGKGFLTGGILLMLSGSAAVFRAVHNIMADINGRPRFRELYSWPLSCVFSLVFLAVMYFAVLVVLLGDRLLTALSTQLRFVDPEGLWRVLRFPLLFLILLVMLWGLYRITSPRDAEKRRLLPGAFAAAVGIEGISVLFSQFIGLSARYALVYGSLASLIVLALWLYLCCTVLIMGSALNVVLGRRRED